MSNVIVIVVIALILVLGLRGTIKHFKGEGGCCGGGGTIAEKTVKLSNPVVAKKEIIIEGMHCDNCKNRVTRFLQNIKGVSCKVDLKKKTAFVEMDHEVSDKELTDVIEKCGYQVVEIR